MASKTKSFDDITIKVSVSLGLANCQMEITFTYDREQWEDLSDEEREETCKEAMFDMIEWSYEKEDD